MPDLKQISNGSRQSAKLSVPDTTLMVDANCAWSVEKAVRMPSGYCRQTTFSGLKSQSTATITEDTKHCAKSHKIIGIQIATGENGYGLHYFQTLIDCEGADVFNLDVAILPGYEPALQVVEEALTAEKLIAPHGAQELQIHIAASRDNGLMLEYYPPAVDPLRGEMFSPNDGFRI